MAKAKSQSRGLDLEKAINNANLEYRKQGVAVIIKLATPFLITNRGLIPQVSTVDYMGCYTYSGITTSVAFDAKETASETSFPFSNIKDHQLLFLNLWKNTGGRAFLLINFTKTGDYYALPIEEVNTILETGKKSIKKSAFKEEWKVKIGDYLSIL